MRGREVVVISGGLLQLLKPVKATTLSRRLQITPHGPARRQGIVGETGGGGERVGGF